MLLERRDDVKEVGNYTMKNGSESNVSQIPLAPSQARIRILSRRKSVAASAWTGSDAAVAECSDTIIIQPDWGNLDLHQHILYDINKNKRHQKGTKAAAGEQKRASDFRNSFFLHYDDMKWPSGSKAQHLYSLTICFGFMKGEGRWTLEGHQDAYSISLYLICCRL